MIAWATQHVRYWAGLVGKSGLVGIAMLLIAGALVGSVLLPQQQRVEQLERDIEKARRAPPVAAEDPVETQEVKVEKFYRSLPQSQTTPDWLQRVFDAATANNVTLEQGEYTLLSNPNAKLEQYRIMFPVKGTYPDLRGFASASLAAVPALALESVYLKREKIADGAVDAKITFLLYLERVK